MIATVYEQLAVAFPLHFHRIVECIYAFDPRGGDEFLESLAYADAGWALYDAFDWAPTTEGGKYWIRLADGARPNPAHPPLTMQSE